MASTYMPKVIQNRGKTPAQIARDNFERSQNASIAKAINDEETCVKEKHVRIIILGTHQDRNAAVFWNQIRHVLQLHNNSIMSWKFCYVSHRLVRDGHPEILKDSLRYLSFILELGKYWGHLDAYGKLIAHYIKLLIGRFKFHRKYSAFPGTLELSKNGLTNLCSNDINIYFELCVDLLDLMDDLLSLQLNVFNSLDNSRSNSMTNSGQCRLSPMILLIQDSCFLYDYLVQTLFKLHSVLPADTLDGHRQRFLHQYNVLKKFYLACTNLQYFRNLIKVPTLADTPPNFLLQSDIKVHKAPVATVVETPVEDLIDTSPQKNTKEEPNYQEIIASLMQEIERLKRAIDDAQTEDGFLIESLKTHIQDLEKQIGDFKLASFSNSEETTTLKQLLEESEQKASLEKTSEVDSTRISDEKLKKMKDIYSKLREEHLNLLRKQNETVRKYKQDITEMENKQKLVLNDKLGKVISDYNEERLQFSSQEENNLTELNNMKLSLEASKNDKCDLDEQLNKYKQHNDDLETRHTELEQRMTDVKVDNLDEIRSLSKSYESQNTRLQQLKDTAASQNEELKSSLEQAKSLNVTLENDLSEKTSALNNQIDTFNDSLQDKESSHSDAISKLQVDDLIRRRALLSSTTEACQHSLVTSKQLATDELYDAVTCSQEFLIAMCTKALNNVTNVKCHFNEFNIIDNEITDQIVCVNTFTKVTSSLIEHGIANSNTAAEDTSADIKDMCADIADTSISMLADISKGDDIISADTSKVTASMERLLSILEKNSSLRIEVTEDEMNKEMSQTSAAIEEAAQRIAKILAESRLQHSGVQLEVNERILESCNSLMIAIKVLIENSKGVQNEIVAQNRGASTSKEFYKKHNRWTEGLISAAKAVGKGANVLVDAADKVVAGTGKLEELMVCSQEISSSTAQLVVASKVKAPKYSEKLAALTEASKGVTSATGKVVATAKSASQTIEDLDTLDFTKLTLHQAKRLEMDSQVHLLELEHSVEIERRKLSQLRRKHYQLAGEGDD